MSPKSSYDLLIIGSGSAGFSAIEGAHALGARICVIEKGKLGGECPNDACVPMKALLKAAQFYRSTQLAKTFGVQLGNISFQFSDVATYRKKVVETMTGGGVRGDRYESFLKKMHVDVRYGEAKFVNDHTLMVNGEALTGKTILIATGTTDFIPPINGLDQIHFLGWKQAMTLTRQPKSIAIIGGGPVGCELATYFASFGTRVVLLQRFERLLHQEDAEFALLGEEMLKGLGVEVITGAHVSEIVDGRGGVYGVRVTKGSSTNMHAVEHIVLATGKRVHVEQLGLDSTDVSFDERGFINTNLFQETSVPHIFSAGDVDGGYLFTHTAHHEGWVAGFNAARLALKKRTPKKRIDERVVPHILFLPTEFASVGMTEEMAKQKFKHVLVGRSEIAHLGRSVTEHDRTGRIKLIAHPKTRKVLGGSVMASRAGEMIHEVALAMHLNATVDKLGSMIHAFPTYSEGIAAAASRMQLD